MESQSSTGQTSDLERELREAEEAQAEADAALQRAAMARAEAETAQRRAKEEQEASRRAWAQGVVDTYDSDLAAADTAVDVGDVIVGAIAALARDEQPRFGRGLARTGQEQEVAA